MWIPELGGRPGPRYRAIVDALAEAVAGGVLRPGDRLPTHRDLAWRLGVNTSTVTQAYREAARRHLIGGEVGRGTFVLADSREAALFGLKEAPASFADLSTNVPALEPGNADLTGTLAALVAEGIADACQGYHAPALLTRARVAGAAWLALRDLEVRPSAIVPCAGAQQALAAVLGTLCRPGNPILVEALTFPGMKAVARQLGLKPHGVAMDGEGMLPEALDRAARATGAEVVVAVPALQNPTGAVMGEDRRRAVAEVVRRRGLLLVEDDIYGALTDAPPLSGLLPDRGVLVTSLSKTVAAGLRMGWIAGPPAVVGPIAAEIHATSWALSPLMLEVACRWVGDGTAERRARWQRAEIAWRFGAAARALGLIGERRRQPSPHVWVPVAGDAGAASVRCRAAGVEVVPGPLFAVGREDPRRVRIAVGAPATRRELSAALARLAASGQLLPTACGGGGASPVRDPGGGRG